MPSGSVPKTCSTPPPYVKATKGGSDDMFDSSAPTSTCDGHDPSWSPNVSAKSGHALTADVGLWPARKPGSAPCTVRKTVATHTSERQLWATVMVKFSVAAGSCATAGTSWLVTVICDRLTSRTASQLGTDPMSICGFTIAGDSVGPQSSVIELEYAVHD